MNLAVNARDAMPRGGKLTIETHNVELDETYADATREARAGEYVLLAVADTGSGMDAPESRPGSSSRSSPPRGRAKARGLGLATVYGIVKQSGGHIDVYSEPGVGTTFQGLPASRARRRSRPARPDSKPSAPTGTETILLVEDADGVRTLARLVLQARGYKVLEACNGGEALLACENSKETIHILVTDVVMPNMSGRQLAERLSPLRPAMKVLYLSGYTDDAIVRHGILDSHMPFLQKPFSPDALAQGPGGAGNTMKCCNAPKSPCVFVLHTNPKRQRGASLALWVGVAVPRTVDLDHCGGCRHWP